MDHPADEPHDAPAAAPDEPRSWICVVSREDALVARATDAVRLSATGEQRLRRLRAGDGVLLYSPREQNKTGEKVQRFTAVGVVTGVAPYQRDDDLHGSWFRDVVFDRPTGEVQVRPLLGALSFVRDAEGWGIVFRPGFLSVTQADFDLVRRHMAATTAPRGEPPVAED